MEARERLLYMINAKIIEYTFEEEESKDYIDFMKELYFENEYSDYYINSIDKLKNKSNPSFKYLYIKNFILYDGDRVVGHISAIIDPRLSAEQKVGIFGFYECIDNLEVSRLLIKTAIGSLKNQQCKIIRGPIDLTIWHPYRFVIDQKDSFILESITKPYYIDQFKREDFLVAAEYASGERSDFQTILPYTKSSYERILNEGFKIVKVNKENYDKLMPVVYEIARETFTESWSYTEISYEEFIFLYQGFKNNLENLFIEIVYNKEDKAVGFSLSILDPIKDKTIILKTIAVLSYYQNKKVGAALLYSQHSMASEKGFSKEIYALIKTGNKVTQLPYPGASIIRRYVAFEKVI